MSGFKPGQRVYTADGRIGEFVIAIENGPFIIRPVFETCDGGGEPYDYADGLIEVSAIYPKPPVAKLDEAVAEKNIAIATLRDEIRALEAEKRAFGQDHKEREARIERHGQLATLDQFLAGEITHVVMRAGYGSGLKIVPFAEALKVPSDDRYSRRDPEMKLVSLFGDSKGNLSWRINEYRDGSGSWIVMSPCTSQEDARGVVENLLAAKWAAFRDQPAQPWVLRDAMDTADELGIAIPNDIREAVDAHQRAATQAAVEKAERELAVLRAAALAKTQAGE